MVMVINVKKGQGTNQTWDGIRRNLLVTFYQNFLQGVFPFMLKFYRKISIPFYYKYQTLSLQLFKTKRLQISCPNTSLWIHDQEPSDLPLSEWQIATTK